MPYTGATQLMASLSHHSQSLNSCARSMPKTAGSLSGNCALTPEPAWESKLSPELLPSRECFKSFPGLLPCRECLPPAAAAGPAEEPTVNTHATAMTAQSQDRRAWKRLPRPSSPTLTQQRPVNQTTGTECHVQTFLKHLQGR